MSGSINLALLKKKLRTSFMNMDIICMAFKDYGDTKINMRQFGIHVILPFARRIQLLPQ